MYRSLALRVTAIIVMLAAAAPTVAAQRGFGGGGGGGFGGGGGGAFRGGGGGAFRGGGGGVSVFRGAPVVQSAPGSTFIGRPVAPFVTSPVQPFGRSPFVAPPFAGRPFRGGHSGFGRFPRTIVVEPVIGYGYYSPYIWPTTTYPVSPYYGSYDAGYASPTVSAPAVSQGEVDLAYQVGRLSAEIQQLREQQQTLRPSQQPQGQTQSAPAVPTVLVFRDGHRVEIQNYAIIGQTLWVLDERSSTKISISDLDLDATQKENRSRGLRFPLPEK